MSDYRLYYLDGSGKIDLAEWIKAENDRDAVAQARVLKRAALKCEVWRGKRLVASLNADDLAPSSWPTAIQTMIGPATAHPAR